MNQIQVQQLSVVKAGELVIAAASNLGEVEHAYTCASCNNDCDGAWVRIKSDYHRHYILGSGVLIETGGENCIPF